MISKEKFYTRKEELKGLNKIKIWWRVKKEIRIERGRSTFDVKSFLFGSAFTFAVIIIVVLLVRFVPEIINKNQTDDVKIEHAYNNAITELENSLPSVINSLDKDNRNKELLYAHIYELKEIDMAVTRFKSESYEYNYSPLIQERLLRFYQLKIEVINKIIMMKGDNQS